MFDIGGLVPAQAIFVFRAFFPRMRCLMLELLSHAFYICFLELCPSRELNKGLTSPSSFPLPFPFLNALLYFPSSFVPPALNKVLNSPSSLSLRTVPFWMRCYIFLLELRSKRLNSTIGIIAIEFAIRQCCAGSMSFDIDNSEAFHPESRRKPKGKKNKRIEYQLLLVYRRVNSQTPHCKMKYRTSTHNGRA